MTWTTRFPQMPGLYQWRKDAESEPVNRYLSIQNSHFRLMEISGIANRAVFRDPPDDGEWSGPYELGGPAYGGPIEP